MNNLRTRKTALNIKVEAVETRSNDCCVTVTKNGIEKKKEKKERKKDDFDYFFMAIGRQVWPL